MKKLRPWLVVLFLSYILFGSSSAIGASQLRVSSAVEDTLVQYRYQTPLNLEIPKTIRVRITGDQQCNLSAPYTVQVIDFESYVKHVLPSEWNPSARAYPEVLRAGAIAVKMYAWYWIQHGGKWKDADVWDNICDQVYNPALSFEVTDRAVEDTWNWVLTRNDQIFPTYHLQTCSPPSCMGQLESEAKARSGLRWDDLLAFYYPGSRLSVLSTLPGGFTLYFNGQPGDGQQYNRVFFSLVDPDRPEVKTNLNVGSEDFTIEWWLKANLADNKSNRAVCGKNKDWIYGNILIDMGHTNIPGGFGVALFDGRVAFGVTGPGGKSLTICSISQVTDMSWHHIAIQRRISDGKLWLYIDGKLETTGNASPGDITYPTGIAPNMEYDSYLSLGGWKQDNDSITHPFFHGWLDELRFSNNLRYNTQNFLVPDSDFIPDSNTLALFSFDEGIGHLARDKIEGQTSASYGRFYHNGLRPGLEWVTSDLFITYNYRVFLPLLRQ